MGAKVVAVGWGRAGSKEEVIIGLESARLRRRWLRVARACLADWEGVSWRGLGAFGRIHSRRRTMNEKPNKNDSPR